MIYFKDCDTLNHEQMNATKCIVKLSYFHYNYVKVFYISQTWREAQKKLSESLNDGNSDYDPRPLLLL